MLINSLTKEEFGKKEVERNYIKKKKKKLLSCFRMQWCFWLFQEWCIFAFVQTCQILSVKPTETFFLPFFSGAGSASLGLLKMIKRLSFVRTFMAVFNNGNARQDKWIGGYMSSVPCGTGTISAL